MLRFFNRCSKRRGAWLILVFTALGLELTALYFQHIMLLRPCVMCIYERCALFGILGAGFIGMLAPKTILRYAAIFLWLYSAWSGLHLAWRHTMTQLHPSPLNTCDFFAHFPSWLPLDKWIPSVFQATGDCSLRQWEFLSLDMAQWMVVIFAVYLLIGVWVFCGQFAHQRRRDLFSH